MIFFMKLQIYEARLLWNRYNNIYSIPRTRSDHKRERQVTERLNFLRNEKKRREGRLVSWMEQAERRPFCGAPMDNVLSLLDREWRQSWSTSHLIGNMQLDHKKLAQTSWDLDIYVWNKTKDHAKIILFKHIT